MVQVNVAGLSLLQGSAIQAKGEDGNGGVIALNSSGPVDIRESTLIDSSGRVSSGLDTNVISIEGSLVHMDGTLRADGVDPKFGGSRGGTIRLVSNGAISDTGYEISPQSQKLVDQNMSILNHAWDDATRRTSGDTAPPTFQTSERQQWQERIISLLNPVDLGSVSFGGGAGTPYFPSLNANGTRGGIDRNNDYVSDTVQRAGDGGSIIILSSKHLFNQFGSKITANGAIGLPGDKPGTLPTPGGNGGTVALLARYILFNQHLVQANGGRGGWSNHTKPIREMGPDCPILRWY